MVVGRLIPAGTGLAYHAERKKNKENKHVEEVVSTVSADDVEAALSQALNK